MEENNNIENNNSNNETKHSIQISQCWKAYLGILAAAFIGGFLAIYFVADRFFDRPQNAFYPPVNMDYSQVMRDFDRMYERERRLMEHDFEKIEKNLNKEHKKHFGNNKDKSMVKMPGEFLNPFAMPSYAHDGFEIESKLDDDKYKVKIDLKAFQNDESKINYNVSGRKLTVFGNSTVKEKDFEQEISFSQDFVLPKNAELSKIYKKRDGDDLIIEVPIKK